VNATTLDPHAKRLALREILARPVTTVMPGGFSPIYARMCEEIGFECFFVSGSQMSAFLLGVPDDGLIGLRDVVDHVRHVASATAIPILADADTGFGNVTNVRYAVAELIRAGAAALQIEDQEWPKTPAPGRRSIPVAEMVAKLRAAVQARDALDPAFVIAARCDELDADGGTFESVLERCIAYGRDGGADLVWFSSIRTRDQLRTVCRAVAQPVLALWGMGGEAPPTTEECTEIGARIVLYPTLASTSGLQSAWDALSDFHARGPVALAEAGARAQQSPWGRLDWRRFAAPRKGNAQ
jgi:2-methylisocitrate lyase-like PEP mutase family enzyme